MIIIFFSIIFIKLLCRFTLYTSSKPPSPSLLSLEKLLVAVAKVARLKKGTSKSSFWRNNTFSPFYLMRGRSASHYTKETRI